ncbi:zinc finger protein 85-like isoform X2 [Pelobates fuscus]
MDAQDILSKGDLRVDQLQSPCKQMYVTDCERVPASPSGVTQEKGAGEPLHDEIFKDEHIQPDPCKENQSDQEIPPSQPPSTTCTMCDKTFDTSSMLTEHVESTHSQSGLPDNFSQYFCAECGRGFQTLLNLEKHQLLHRGDRPQQVSFWGKKLFQCCYCSRRFSTNTHLQRHHKNCSKKDLPPEPPGTKEEEHVYRKRRVRRRVPHKDDLRINQPQLSCRELYEMDCARVQGSSPGVTLHKGAGDPLQCCIASEDEMFKDSHVKLQHSKENQPVQETPPSSTTCAVCNKTFPNSSALTDHCENAHSQSELSEKVFVYRCGVCGRGFQTLLNLEKHQLLHRGDRPQQVSFWGKKLFQCRYCSHRFSTKMLLQQHYGDFSQKDLPEEPTETQDEEQSHMSCLECGLNFTEEEDLHQHYIQHARGEL